MWKAKVEEARPAPITVESVRAEIEQLQRHEAAKFEEAKTAWAAMCEAKVKIAARGLLLKRLVEIDARKQKLIAEAGQADADRLEELKVADELLRRAEESEPARAALAAAESDVSRFEQRFDELTDACRLAHLEQRHRDEQAIQRQLSEVDQQLEEVLKRRGSVRLLVEEADALRQEAHERQAKAVALAERAEECLQKAEGVPFDVAREVEEAERREQQLRSLPTAESRLPGLFLGPSDFSEVGNGLLAGADGTFINTRNGARFRLA